MVACFETLVSLNGNFSFIGRNFSFEPWKCGFIIGKTKSTIFLFQKYKNNLVPKHLVYGV